MVYHLWFFYELIASVFFTANLANAIFDSDGAAKYFVVFWLFIMTARLVSAVSGWNFPLVATLILETLVIWLRVISFELCCLSPTLRTAGVCTRLLCYCSDRNCLPNILLQRVE